MGTVEFEIENHIGHVVLNHPEKRNAVDAAMSATLAEIYAEVARSDNIRVVVISGAGGKAFCAGGYIPSYLDKNVVGAEGTGQRTELPKPWRIYKPFIAAIEGYCVGGGFGLALTCDIRIASRGSTIGPSGLKRGLMNGATQTSRLVRLVGLGNALEVLLTSKYMNAEDAYRIGLVQRLVDAGEVLPLAMEMAETIASFSPEAVAATKRVAYDNLDLTWDEALEWEDEVTIENFRTPDALEGYASFLEHRPAVFGRNEGGVEALGVTAHWPNANVPAWRQ